MKKRLHRISTEGCRKTVIGLALASLLALPVLCLYPHHTMIASARPKARMQSQDLKQRATRIGLSLGGANPIIGEPEFVIEKLDKEMPRRERRLWVVDCLVGSHSYTLIFNDVTGNVQSLFSDGTTSSSRSTGVPTLSSPSDALEEAIRHLKDLQMVPKGTRIVLAQQPQRNRDGITWRLSWKVLCPGIAAPSEVRMVLNGSDATPMSVVNCNELNKYAQN